MLKGMFSLTLRATEGLLDSLFQLMNVPLCAPDYSCVSKRARTVKVAYRQPTKGRITDLVIDSTGLKVFGEGECGSSWAVFMRMTPMPAKPAISLSRTKGRQLVSRLARTRDSGKRGTQEMRQCW